MKKKFLTLYSLGLGCSILAGHEAKAEKNNLDNIYMGGHFGYITTDTKAQIRGALEYGGGNTLKLSGHRINGGIHIGVGCFHGQNFPIYLGAEILAALSNMQTTESRAILNAPRAGSIKLNHKHSFGAAVRIGAYVAKAMPYIKTGYMNGRWEFKSTLDPTVDPTANSYAKTKKSLPGWLLGIGVDIPVNEKIVLGLEGIHCRYKKFNLTHYNASPLFPVNKHLQYKIKPQVNILQVRLSFRI